MYSVYLDYDYHCKSYSKYRKLLKYHHHICIINGHTLTHILHRSRLEWEIDIRRYYASKQKEIIVSCGRC